MHRSNEKSQLLIRYVQLINYFKKALLQKPSRARIVQHIMAVKEYTYCIFIAGQDNTAFQMHTLPV